MIRNCGQVNYANQIYWEGFGLKECCKYKFSFDVHSSIKRKIGYRIQLNSGDYHAYDSKRVDVNTDINHIESVFTMNRKSDPAPRLCFNMGIQSNMKEDPGEHQIWIDNINLILLDDSGAVESDEENAGPQISINQVGYQPTDMKTLVTSGDFSGQEFSVKNVETGEFIYTGTLGSEISDKATKQNLCRGDFSELSDDGTYQIVIGEEAESPTFKISNSVNEDLFKASCYNFPGTVAPQNETGELVLAPISMTGTADFAAIMAKAAVDYKMIDSDFSSQCLDAALNAWDYVENTKSPKGFTNPPEISTGEYGDSSSKAEIC